MRRIARFDEFLTDGSALQETVLQESEDPKPDDVWYHGSDTKNLKFDSDFTPIFFTKSKKYARGYGKFVHSYKLNIKNPLDTKDPEGLKFYNEKFIPWAKEHSNDKRYEKLSSNESVPMITADLLYLFLRKSKREGLNHNYDGVIVDESGFEFDDRSAKYSVFPLSYSQIENTA